MTTENLGYKEYKCPKCGWVHAAIPLQAVPAEGDMERYLRCFNCRAHTSGFVPAGADDAPDGCTLQPALVPGAWDEYVLA